MGGGYFMSLQVKFKDQILVELMLATRKSVLGGAGRMEAIERLLSNPLRKGEILKKNM